MVWSPQQKAFYVIQFARGNGPTAIQRSFRTKYQLAAHAPVPDRKSIKRWFTEFENEGKFGRKKRVNTKFVFP